MDAVTVNGRIDGDRLGVTLSHEHLKIDQACWYERSPGIDLIGDAPVESVDREILRMNPYISKDNLVLDDLAIAVQEVKRFKQLGGSSIIDVTVPGIGRDPVFLKRVSEASGVNIICATGWYVESSHPSIVRQMGVDELAEIMRKELTDGIDNTSVRAGMIGEIGTTGPITENENKVLQAAARAHKATGAPIAVHVLAFLREKYAFNVLDILEKEDVDLSHVIICHVDFDNGLNKAYHTGLMERGAFIGFDNFGVGYPDCSQWLQTDGSKLLVADDSERIRVLHELAQIGFVSRIVLSHDTCMKLQLRKYGGVGYSHILERVVPRLRSAGISEKDIRSMLVENPKRLFAYS